MGSGWTGRLDGDLGQALEVAVRFEEEQPAFVFREVDLDVTVGQLPWVHAVVADIAHEAGELAECVCHPPAVAGQAVAQGVRDRALELCGAVAVGNLVYCGHVRAQALGGCVPVGCQNSAMAAELVF
jgi:hypothetical protein